MASPLLSESDGERCLRLGRRDPSWWLQNFLGVEPWSTQRSVLEAVRDHRSVAVKSCNGAGKTWLAGHAALWWLYTRPPAIVITTAPTDRQVRTQLWKEIRTAHTRAPIRLGGDLLQQELKIAPDWYAIGFTAPDNDPSRFQGFHEENILVIIDEACGVSQDIYEAIEGVLASGTARRLEIGNPTDPNTTFGESFHKDPDVHKLTIDAFSTPNFTEFGITQADIEGGDWQAKVGELPQPHLITPEWAAHAFEKWGPESPFYKSRVLAEFPDESEDTLIPLAWIERAQRKDFEPGIPVRLGVDVARFGPDETVLYLRRGPHVRLYGRAGKQDTMATTGQVAAAIKATGCDTANVDSDGLGAGVLDRLKEQKLPVSAIHGGMKPRDPEKFVNNRAEWYWGLRQRFEHADIDIDPRDEELAVQLSALRWKLDSRGRIAIETKDEMRRRGMSSPDRADGVAYAFAETLRRPGDWGISL